METTKRPKIVFLGDICTGKTSIIRRLCFETFSEDQMTTKIPSNLNLEIEINSKKVIVFDVWDTAGQEKFRSVNKLYYKNATCIFLVYDITNKKSFDSIVEYWVPHVKESKCKMFYLVGNKADLFSKAQVKESDVREYAESIQASFYLTSAKNGLGLREMILQCAQTIDNTVQERKNSLNLEKAKNTKNANKQCCQKN